MDNNLTEALRELKGVPQYGALYPLRKLNQTLPGATLLAFALEGHT